MSIYVKLKEKKKISYLVFCWTWLQVTYSISLLVFEPDPNLSEINRSFLGWILQGLDWLQAMSLFSLGSRTGKKAIHLKIIKMTPWEWLPLPLYL